MGLDARKPVVGVCEQPRHIPACASAQTVQRLCYSFFFLESITFRLATSEISIFQLVSLAEETGLSLPSSVTLKTGFVASIHMISVL